MGYEKLCKGDFRGGHLLSKYGLEFVDEEGSGGGQRLRRWPPPLREGCGGRPEGAVSPRRARRDGALRTPQQPDPSAARDTPKPNLEEQLGISQISTSEEAHFEIIKQGAIPIAFEEEVRQLPYTFQDSKRFDQKVDSRKRTFWQQGKLFSGEEAAGISLPFPLTLSRCAVSC